MRFLRKICWMLLVWTTAASTLLAGTPHMVCRCADGNGTRQMPIPVTAACCCTGRCALPPAEGKLPETKKTKKPSCCQRYQHAQKNKDGFEATAVKGNELPTGPALKPNGCHKELGKVDRGILANQDGANLIHCNPSLVYSFSWETGEVGAVLGVVRFSREECQRPPPSDLITVFQHLTI